MRKVFVLISMVLFIATSVVSQVKSPAKESILNSESKNVVAVYDSTLVKDHKLNVVFDRLFSQNGLRNLVIQEVTKEKDTTGKILNGEQVEQFFNEISLAYNKFAISFINIDTVYVDSSRIETEIKELVEWQSKVLGDSTLVNSTSFGVWKSKTEQLNKLVKYSNQLKK